MPRWIHRLYAWLLGYFWAPCPVCGREFGGHEWDGTDTIPTDRPYIRRGVCSPGCAQPEESVRV